MTPHHNNNKRLRSNSPHTQDSVACQSSTTDPEALWDQNWYRSVYNTIIPWVITTLTLTVLLLSLWYSPHLCFGAFFRLITAIVGHIVFSILNWKYEPSGRGVFETSTRDSREEMPFLSILEYKVFVTKCPSNGALGKRGPWHPVSVLIYLSPILRNILSSAEKKAVGKLNELGQMLVSALLTKAAKMPDFNNPSSPEKSEFGTNQERRILTGTLSHMDIILQVTPESQDQSSGALCLSAVGLLFSSSSGSTHLSEGLETRYQILRVQIVQRSVRELEDVCSDMWSLLLNLSPDTWHPELSACATLKNAEILRRLAHRISKLLYLRKDITLMGSWWHDSVLPTELSERDINELKSWIKICLHRLVAKKTNLLEMEKSFLGHKLKGKMERLPRGFKERCEEKKQAGAKYSISSANRITTKRSYMGMAGDLACDPLARLT
ncbi:hypothetical protein BS50DRAFT_589052 [Corynespora cassiicola Philippines]|uniref:Uncharacterized protein n=1 Tax=Corynespora cassiicola Philippines TaxID=1448308 RepID=A0A2T2NLK0_CORCC|nr:hypothetical protein BS50DRAFT_589052 [Corynespora cassiicola Philippines]